jgi:energy-coupling factor transport system substrate-specific component
VTERTSASDKAETFDDLVAALHRLRVEAGTPSYDELASRITRRRESQGLAPAAARVARSTVYDAFRPGRTRINVDLLADLVASLDENEAAVAEWRLRCMSARLVQAPRRVDAPTFPLVSHSLSPSAGPIIRALVMLAALGLNLFGNAASSRVNAPLFLDMIGTAIVAIAFGPWFGSAVAVSTNLLAGVSNTPYALPFMAVNVVGALVWGYGVRAWGLGRTPLRFFSLNVIAALACTLTAAPILALNVSRMITDAAPGGLFAALERPGVGFWAAAIASNLTVSLGDKLVAGYLGLGVVLVLARQSASYVSLRRPPVLWNLSTGGENASSPTAAEHGAGAGQPRQPV